MEGKYLITTDNWFYAPNGKTYKAAWGDVTILEDTFLGLKTNKNATNWYAKVGPESNHIIIAGCQIHYVVKCENEPNTEEITDYSVDDGKVNTYNRPSNIYIAK